MEQRVLSVTQINNYIKGRMDADPLLGGLLVRGELSNYKIYPSGHHYFTLKDGDSSLRCVMYQGKARSLRFRPADGMQVIASGNITVFPRDGGYKLYCDTLSVSGVGDLHMPYEQLKEKLHREGLFDPAHKKPLPRYPQRIVVITSGAGAVPGSPLGVSGVRLWNWITFPNMWPATEMKATQAPLWIGLSWRVTRTVFWREWRSALWLLERRKAFSTSGMSTVWLSTMCRWPLNRRRPAAFWASTSWVPTGG